jgi:hypothetical protein
MSAFSIVSNYLNSTLQNLPKQLRYLQNDIHYKEFHPDINGYSIITMFPPHLSGDGAADSLITDACDRINFLALDITPPEVQLKNSQIGSGKNIMMSYGTGSERSGQLSINYVESNNLEIFTMHQVWHEYVSRVSVGDIDPSGEYMSGKAPIIDYMANAYVARYNPGFDSLLYLGKAAGIYPINLPSKEIIGARSANELSMVPMNYNCIYYATATDIINGGSRNDDLGIFQDFADQISN